MQQSSLHRYMYIYILLHFMQYLLYSYVVHVKLVHSLSTFTLLFIVHPLLLSPPTPSLHPTGVRCATVLWRAVSTSPVTVPLETVCARSLLKGSAVTLALLVSASWRPSIHRDVQQVCSIEQTTVMVELCVTSGLAQ